MPVSVNRYAAQGNVSLEVFVGQAQLGHITAFLNREKVAEAWGQLPTLQLGQAQELRGKTLTVNAVVLDIQPATDLTSVLAELKDTNGAGLSIDQQEVSQGRLPVNYFYVVMFQ